ncbi:MAG: hypothetical protein H0W49_14805 [Nitrospirales bacterium]|nr:hypothetical protein [Nitrospirales bacterium]
MQTKIVFYAGLYTPLECRLRRLEAIIRRSVECIERWRRKASESEDPFDRFFGAWIALVIAARGRLCEQQLSQPDTDRKAIIQYFESRAEGIDKVLRALRDNTAWLAARKGMGTHEPILDVYPFSPEHLRQVFDTLAQVWAVKRRENRHGWPTHLQRSSITYATTCFTV